MLTILQMRADLEEHADRRSSRWSHIKAAGDVRNVAEQCTNTSTALTLPHVDDEPDQQIHNTLPLTRALSRSGRQLPPRVPSAPHSRMEPTSPCAEESGSQRSDSRHKAAPELQQTRQGFELQWLPVQPSSRHSSDQAAPALLPRRDAPYHSTPASPCTQAMWLPPPDQLQEHMQLDQLVVQQAPLSAARRVTGERRPDLPRTTSRRRSLPPLISFGARTPGVSAPAAEAPQRRMSASSPLPWQRPPAPAPNRRPPTPHLSNAPPLVWQSLKPPSSPAPTSLRRASSLSNAEGADLHANAVRCGLYAV